MRRLAIVLAALLLVVPAAALGGAPGQGDRGGAPASRGDVPRLQCGQPRRLHLERYEDGSARLLCGPRLLARVGVPW
jgi:hypothetical protein